MASDVVAPPIKNWRTTSERIEKFLSESFFQKYNLTSQLYKTVQNLTDIPNFSCGQSRPLWKDIKDREFQLVDVTRTSFGPTWATFWFKLDFALLDFAALFNDYGEDFTLGLQWKCDCEALLYSSEGVPLQSFSEERTFYPFPRDEFPRPLYVELACNGMFGAGEHCIKPPVIDKMFKVSQVAIVARNDVAYKLYHTLDMLHDVAKDLGRESVSGRQSS